MIIIAFKSSIDILTKVFDFMRKTVSDGLQNFNDAAQVNEINCEFLMHVNIGIIVIIIPM